MSNPRDKRTHRIVTAAAVLLLAGTAPAYSAKPEPTKPYRAVMAPATVTPGLQTFTLTLHNDSSQQQLGSADVTAPSAFTITGISAPSGSSFTSAVASLRNLAIPPSTSSSVTITADVPCAAGVYAWSVVAKQANDFNGPPGNNFTLDDANSSLTTTVSSSCVLAFVTGRQPADAEKDATISSVAFTPSGSSVQVEVQDGSGNRVTSSTAAITVAISAASPDPGAGASLSGTKTVAAVQGVSSFSTLSIDVNGAYKLAATSPGLTSATSAAFTIWDDVAECTGGQTCSTSVSSPQTMSSTVSATPDTAGFLLTSLDVGATLPCDDSFNHTPGVTTVNSLNLSGGTKTVVLTVDKRIDQQQPNNGVAFYQVCYESDTAWVDRDGEAVPPGAASLLPDCVSAPAPCVQSKTKTRAGDVLITVVVPLVDPRMW